MKIRLISIFIFSFIFISSQHILSAQDASSEAAKQQLYQQIIHDPFLLQLIQDVSQNPGDRVKADNLLIQLPLSPVDMFRMRMESNFREYLIPKEIWNLHQRWLQFHPQFLSGSLIQNLMSLNSAFTPSVPTVDINRNVASTFATAPQNYQGEVQLSVNRNNTNQIVAGANTWDTPAGCDQTQAAFGSTNGGTSWSYTCTPSKATYGLSCPSANDVVFGSDPAVAWDNNGTSYFNYMLLCCSVSCQFGFSNPTSSLVVAKSTDTGQTWQKFGVIVNHLANANSGFDDKEFYAIDNNPASPHFGRHYECWDNNNNEQFAFSDNGTTWTVVNLPASSLAVDLGCEMAIQSDGTIHLVFDSLTCSGSTCSAESSFYTHSTNGGVAGSWSAPVLIKAHNIFGFNSSSKIAPENNRGINPFGAIDVDNSPGSAHPGRLYFSYSDVNNGASMGTSDVYVAWSDNGTVWNPVKVNDDATTTAQFHPFLVVDQTNGNVNVGWHDARNDTANNRKIDFYMSRSTDGGVTWEANTKVSQPSSEFNNNAISYSDENTTDNPNYNPNQYGEYLGVDAHNGKVYMAWTDTRHYFPNNSSTQIENLGFAAVTFAGDGIPPTTSITSPTSGTVKGTINVDATANDNVGVTKVEFYLDGSTLIGTDTTSPYSISWNTTTASNGAHNLTSKAYDAANNTGTSTAVNVTVDNASPTTSITSPTAGSFVKGTINVNANASDNIGVTKVEFYLDGSTLIGTDTASPYSISWDTTTASNGSHNLTSEAYDAASNTGTSTAVNVTVDNAAPTTSITSPIAGSTVNGTINVNADANDNLGVTKVEFYVDGSTLIGTDTTSPYSITWNTTTVSNSSHNLTTKAYDAANNTGTSANTNVTVNNPSDPTPPTTSITSPTAGATVKGTITVKANASDNVGVTKVEFYLDGSTLIGMDTTSPYSVSWNTASVSEGAHNLTSKAYDAANNIGTSTAVNLTVDRTAPTTSLTSPTPGSNVNGTSSIAANASDNFKVSKVEFYVDGNILIGSDATSPYSINWNTNIVSNGPHNLTSKAYDAVSNTSVSAPVNVNVNNPNSCSVSNQLITNGGFEGNSVGWSKSSSNGNTTGVITNSANRSPHTGTWYSKLDGFGVTTTQSIATSSTTMVIPAESCVASFTFWLSIDTAEGATANDNVLVQIQTKNPNGSFGNWITVATFSNLDSTGLNVYALHSYDLIAYKGKTVKFRFQATENASLQTTFLVDDVALNVTQ